MSNHRLFAQLEFERALGHAPLDALTQAVVQSDQFRANGREREPIHFWVLAGELEEVVQDRLKDVLDGPGLRVIERGELFHQPRIVELVLALATRAAPPPNGALARGNGVQRSAPRLCRPIA